MFALYIASSKMLSAYQGFTSCCVSRFADGSEWVNERPGSAYPPDERPTSGLGGFRPCKRDSSEGLTTTLIRSSKSLIQHYSTYVFEGEYSHMA